jgi:hypothetical protein
MDINVRLDEATLRRMLDEILPITILLDDAGETSGRWVTIERARQLDLIPGEGIRLATSGAMRWPISFVPMTVRLAALQLLLRPIVVGDGAATRLLFRPLIEHADFERLPGFVDRGIVSIINRALETRSERLEWRVAESLALRFALPETLVPLERARVDVVSAALTIDERGISVDVTLDVGVTRAGDEQASPVLGGTEASPAGADPI